MKTKHKTTTVLILAAAFLGAASAQSYGSSTNIETTLVNTDPDTLQSGEQGDILFKVWNTGDIAADNVRVKLLDNYPFQVKEGRKTDYSFGKMVPNQEYQVSTEVVVAEDAPDGANMFKFRILSGDMNRTKEIPVEVQSEDIELKIANLQTQPQQLMPDTDNNQLSIDLVNYGEKEAESVVLEIETPEYFERKSSFSTRKSLGTIAGGEKASAKFNFDIDKQAPSGMTDFQAKLSYSAEDSDEEIENKENFQVYLEGKPQFEITDVESKLQTGATNQLSLTVKNTGTKKSSSTRIRVMDSSDQPFTYDSSSQYIGTLEPGQSGEAVFEVETDSSSEAKDYLIDFEVRGVKDTEVFVEDETVSASVSKTNQGSDSSLPLVAGLIVLTAAGIYFLRDRLRELIER